MADDEQRAIEGPERLFQHLDRLDVEMIGRLVQARVLYRAIFNCGSTQRGWSKPSPVLQLAGGRGIG